MVNKKSVERTKKTNGINSNIDNKITITIHDGGSKDAPQKIAEKEKKEKKEKRAKAKRGRKLKAIKALKQKLQKFKELKEVAKEKNIPIPKEIGETPTDIKDVNSIKAIEILTQELEERNGKIEGLIVKGQQGAQPMGGQMGMGMGMGMGMEGGPNLLVGGVFPQDPRGATIIPSPAQPAQAPAPVVNTAPSTTEEYNNMLQTFSTHLVKFKESMDKLDTIIPPDMSIEGGKTRQEIKDFIKEVFRNETKGNIVKEALEEADSQINPITIQIKEILATISKGRQGNQNQITAANTTETALDQMIKDDTGILTGTSGVVEELKRSKRIAQLIEEIMGTDMGTDTSGSSDTPTDPSSIPSTNPDDIPADTTEQTLKQIRDEIIAELRNQNLPIPADIDEEAKEEYEKQQQQSIVPKYIQEEIDDLKENSPPIPKEYVDKIQIAVETIVKSTTPETLKLLDNLRQSPPPEADKTLVNYIYKLVSERYKVVPKTPPAPPIQPSQPEVKPLEPTQQPITPPAEIPSSQDGRDERIRQQGIALIKAGGSPPQAFLDKYGLVILKDKDEASLNGQIVPYDWYEYLIGYKKLVQDTIPNNVKTFEGGIIQVPPDKLVIINALKDDIIKEYGDFKSKLNPTQKEVFGFPVISQFNNEIDKELAKTTAKLVEEVMKRKGPVSSVVIGDVDMTPDVRATQARFVSGGDIYQVITDAQKGYKKTTDKNTLRQYLDKIEQSKAIANRTMRTLGVGEIGVAKQYKQWIEQANQLKTDISKKLLEMDNPPPYAEAIKVPRIEGENWLARMSGGAIETFYIKDGVRHASMTISAGD